MCADCCTRALSLLEANSLARGAEQTVAKVLVRRGTAYLESKQLPLALQDYERAATIRPTDKQIAEDLRQVRSRVKRKDADHHYKEGELELSLELYEQAVELDDTDIRARSNRTACLLRLFRYEECIEAATELLRDIKGGEKLNAQILVRRGGALAKLGRYAEGIADYEASLALLDDVKVRADLATMKQHFAV